MVPGSGRFDDHWIKNVGTGQTAVLAGLIGSCVFCRRSCFPGCIISIITNCIRQKIKVTFNVKFPKLSPQYSILDNNSDQHDLFTA